MRMGSINVKEWVINKSAIFFPGEGGGGGGAKNAKEKRKKK